MYWYYVFSEMSDSKGRQYHLENEVEVFWVVTSFSVVAKYHHRLGGPRCLHLHPDQ
jgi:hypothetical protein